MIFLFIKGVIFRFQLLVFSGVKVGLKVCETPSFIHGILEQKYCRPYESLRAQLLGGWGGIGDCLDSHSIT